MGRCGNIDYPTIAKRSFLLGASLFVVGIIGEIVGQRLFAPLPAWEQTLPVTIVGGGILVALVAPIVFGVILLLTE